MVLFWILLFLALILLFWAIAIDNGGWGVVVIVVLLGCLYAFGHKDSVVGIWRYIVDDPWRSVVWFVLYVLIGVFYSFAKWYFFLIDKRERTARHVHEYPNNMMARRPPDASNHKDDIFRWIFYWPISMVLLVIDRPFRKLFKFIHRKIGHIYTDMAKSVFKDLDRVQ